MKRKWDRKTWYRKRALVLKNKITLPHRLSRYERPPQTAGPKPQKTLVPALRSTLRDQPQKQALSALPDTPSKPVRHHERRMEERQREILGSMPRLDDITNKKDIGIDAQIKVQRTPTTTGITGTTERDRPSL